MPSQDAARVALARAAKKVGGVAALARRLNISERVLKLYLEGHHLIPDSLFLRAVDLLADEDEKKGRP